MSAVVAGARTMSIAIAKSMSHDDLRRRLRDGVGARLSFGALRTIVVDFAARGGRRDVATAVLDQLGAELGEPDVLLDLLDVACGFCEPRLRIWSDDSYRRDQARELG